jgi:hypothetical protein
MTETHTVDDDPEPDAPHVIDAKISFEYAAPLTPHERGEIDEQGGLEALQKKFDERVEQYVENHIVRQEATIKDINVEIDTIDA